MVSIKNREDIEREVSKEVKKMINSKKKINIEELQKKVLQNLKLEDIKDIINRFSESRGKIIELSIHIENDINQILLLYYSPKNRDYFIKDFLFKTLGFSQKKDIINKIVKKEELRNKNIVSKFFKQNFQDLIEIRNIFAHYPEDVFNNSFYIETSHKKFESMEELVKKFIEISRNMHDELIKITNYVISNNSPNN